MWLCTPLNVGYLDDLALQASILNQSYELARNLLSIFEGVKKFIGRYCWPIENRFLSRPNLPSSVEK